MTCRQRLSMIDDYLDNEISHEQIVAIEAHLKTCPECNTEYKRSVRLKQFLARVSTPDPGDEYFSETAELVLARTVDQPDYRPENRPTDIGREHQPQHQPLMRSLLSLAASIVVLVAAIMFGSNGRLPVIISGDSNEKLLLSVEVSRDIGITESIHYTRDDQIRHARAMLVMGSPGLLGRLPEIPELIVTEVAEKR